MQTDFTQTVLDLIETIRRTQTHAIALAAQLIYARVSQGGTCYATGTGHSHMLAEELYSRAGGLACIHMIAPPEFTLDAHPLKSTMVERIPEYAQVILTQYPIRAGDALIIASNSGRNGLVVELALRARALGASVIAITSLKHGAQCASRHPSGKLLADVADLVIDNCGQPGDAATPVGPGLYMGATSTIAGAYIMQSLAIRLAEAYLAEGVRPPVLRSSNLDGTDRLNQSLFEQESLLPSPHRPQR